MGKFNFIGEQGAEKWNMRREQGKKLKRSRETGQK